MDTRRGQAYRGGWSMLPQNLMDLIIAELVKEDGAHGIISSVAVRQVCKAWRDAFAAYPAEVDVVMNQANGSSVLANMMPTMASLRFTAVVKDLDIAPLGACSQLTSLYIDQIPDIIQEPETPQPVFSVRFECLPPSLETLSVVGVQATVSLPPKTAANLRSLTKLTWQPIKETAARVCDVLRLLPELKIIIELTDFGMAQKTYNSSFPLCDLTLGSLANHPKGGSAYYLPPDWLKMIMEHFGCPSHLDVYFSKLIKLLALSWGIVILLWRSLLETLRLARLDVRHVFIEHVNPMKLRELELTKISFTPASVHGFFRLPIFPCLTRLVLKFCTIVNGGDESMARPLQTLRSLHLERSCPYFYKLAPADLEDLSCARGNTVAHAWGAQPKQPNIGKIIQWTALRRLELQGFSRYASLEPLSTLRLTELSLINCFGGTWPVIEATTFPFLQALHIEDRKEAEFNTNISYLERTLDQFGERILKMPHLIRLSGNGILLAVAKIGALHPFWRLSASSKHDSPGVHIWEKSSAL